MAQQNNPLDGVDWQTMLATGGTVGTGMLAFAKWWESRKKNRGETKQEREDWLIENAFKVVEELRTENDRLSSELERERTRSREKEADWQRRFELQIVRIGELESALRLRGSTTC